MAMVHLEIDGRAVEVPDGASVLEAARSAGADIPTLCHIEGLEPFGGCRLCLVEIEGFRNGLASACSTPAAEGMRVGTATDRVVALRREVLSLILSEHPSDCFNCKKSGDCGLHRYCAEYGVVKAITGGEKRDSVPDISSPFISLDRNKCILCGKCVRVCERLQCCDVLDFSRRGRGTRIGPAFDLGLAESGCVACGNCVSACPVGALMPRDRAYRGALYVDARVPTVCPYCGVGCPVELLVSKGRIVGVEPLTAPPRSSEPTAAERSSASRGLLCVKGRFAYGYVGHADRLKAPLLRKDGRLVPATWDEALDLVAQKMRGVASSRGPTAVAGLSSARCTNEENYLFQKLFRAALGSNNVDHCARLCHSSTVAALAESLGSGAMTGSIEDVDSQDLIFVTGSNTTETHPVIGARIKRAARAGATLIVADPRRIELADEADLYLQIRSGTNEALFGGMARAILDEALEDRAFLDARTEGFEAFARSLEGLTVEQAATDCGIRAEELRAAARLYARSRVAGIYYAMGLTQFARGTAGVLALSSLALLCGKVGKPGSGIYPLRGQNNVQGACDMGCLPGDLPGYAKVDDPAARERFATAWGKGLPVAPGLASTDMMEACARGEIGFLYIMGENPMLSDPDSARTERSLRSSGFLVVQDIFLTETAALADVVLPAACAAEKEGTFTNTERRVQRVRKAVSAPGQARDDAAILAQLMERLGLPQEARGSPAIFAEIARLVPSYAGMTYERLEAGGLQWPCPEPYHPGTPTLHLSSFPRRGGRGRALLVPAERGSAAERVDSEYPFALVTGRILQQYHTRTMTGRVEGLTRIAGSALVDVNPADAAALGLVDGGLALLVSRRGRIEVRARVTDRVGRGELFLPFHFAQAAANKLTSAEPLDPRSRIPELKRCAVRIEPARNGETP